MDAGDSPGQQLHALHRGVGHSQLDDRVRIEVATLWRSPGVKRTTNMLALLLPYVELPDLHLFGLTIHPFGVFAAIGVYVGAVLTVRAGKLYGPGDTKSLSEVFTWALICGVLGAHLLHVFGYHREMLRTEGLLAVLKVWTGVSSMGGVLGLTPAQWITPVLAALGVYLLLNARRMPLASARPVAAGPADEPPDRPNMISGSEARPEEADRHHAPSAR